jgi:hypothetical protein
MTYSEDQMDDYDYDGEDGQGPTETIYNKDDCKM